MDISPTASNTSSGSTSSVSAAASTQNTTTAAGSVQANASKDQIDSNTRIGNLNDLREKSPKVYQKMCEGIGMNICGEMRRHQDRLKKLMNENEAV